MTTSRDTSKWHNISIKIPFPTSSQATLVKQVIEVDKPLRPSELERILEVQDTNLVVQVLSLSDSFALPAQTPLEGGNSTFLARTVAQARVALDHALSDIQLVVQTMHTFGPKDSSSSKTSSVEEAPSLEVGLEGSWGSLKRG